MSDPHPRSPCISVCVLDEHDICAGCYRSAGEIAEWVMCSARQKRDILQRAQARRDAASPVRLG